jgi:hypothetical protein
MLTLKCVNRFKDNHDSWKYYQLVDAQGNQETWTDDKLKSLMASNQVSVINLTLTSDGRLVVSNAANKGSQSMSTDLFQWILNSSIHRNAVNEGLQYGDVVGNLDGFLTHETDSILSFFEEGGKEAIAKNKYMYDLMQSNNNNQIAQIFYKELSNRFKNTKSYGDKNAHSIYVGFNEYEGERLGLDKLGDFDKGVINMNSIQWASDNAETVIRRLAEEGWNKIYIMSLSIAKGGISYTSAGNNSLYFVYRNGQVEFENLKVKRVGNMDVCTMWAYTC